MSNAQSPDARVKHLVEKGQHDEAATLLLELYGKELLGFIINMIREHDAGEDVFQAVCVNIWKGLSGFRWKSSLRSWLYSVARNALISYKRSEKSSKEDRLQTQDMALLPDQMLRTITEEWRKSEVKTWLWNVISELPDDDRTLLVLRLGRGMKWSEIAGAMLDEEEPDEVVLKRKKIALRKRYERLKDKIRDKAKVRDQD